MNSLHKDKPAFDYIDESGEVVHMELSDPDHWETITEKKKHWIRTRSFWWWLKLPVRLAIGFPLCLILALIVWVTLGKKGRIMLWQVVKFAFREEPDEARERLEKFKQYLKDGRKRNTKR